jgi:hypothetical protein
MSEPKCTMTRRDFMRIAGSATIGAAVGVNATAAEKSPSAKRARVVLVRDERAVSADRKVNGEVIAGMLDRGLSELLGISDPVECWRRLVKPSDVVGVKTNVWRNLATPPELEKHIKGRLMEAGLPRSGVLIDDRGARRTLGRCTALVNVRPVRSHHWSGIGGCIKNMIMFSPRPSVYHPDSCANLGAVWSLPPVKGKTRLNILVALTPLFYGRGPHHWDPRYVWPYRGIFVSQDPVAVDALGAHLLQTKRRLQFGGERPVTPTKHIEMAEQRHHLGVSDLKRIDLVKLGWKEDILI